MRKIYVTTEDFFNDEQCDFLEQEAEARREDFFPGVMTIGGRAGVYPEVRNNYTVYIQEGHPLWPAVNMVHEKMRDVNLTTFGFDLDAPWRGDLIRYEGENNSFNWHPDDDFFHDRKPFRKLTAALQLTDPAKYDGGELQIRDEYGVATVPRKRGLLTIFPAFLTHRVTPVTRGTRYSLVTCAIGPRWR